MTLEEAARSRLICFIGRNPVLKLVANVTWTKYLNFRSFFFSFGRYLIERHEKDEKGMEMTMHRSTDTRMLERQKRAFG